MFVFTRFHLVFFALACSSTYATPLIIQSNISGESEQKSFMRVVDAFKEKHPHLNVKVQTTEREAFNEQVESVLSKPKGQSPDVLVWYANKRFHHLAEKGLLRNISDLWKRAQLGQLIPKNLQPLLAYNGNFYGVTNNAYTWGLYYRTDVLEQLGLEPAVTFDQLLHQCKQLHSKGFVPIALGAKYLWTIAGYFDILNLRINGIDFHRALMNGTIPWTDKRVRSVFHALEKMQSAHCFNDNFSELNIMESNKLLSETSKNHPQAAMTYMGMFIDFYLPEPVKSKIGLMRFPNMGLEKNYEDTPTDATFFIAQNAANVTGAEQFLAFMASPEASELSSTWSLPVIKGARITNQQPLFQQALTIFQTTDESSEFLDRDMKISMAKYVMGELSVFLQNPRQLESVLNRLEAERKKQYN